jgi:hypothetical protein
VAKPARLPLPDQSIYIDASMEYASRTLVSVVEIAAGKFEELK